MPDYLYYDALRGQLPFASCCTFKIDKKLLVCSLSNVQLIEPVLASDGYTYEKSQIELWFKCLPDTSLVYSPKTAEILLLNAERQLILYPNSTIHELLTDVNYLTLKTIHDYMHLRCPTVVAIREHLPFENKLLYTLIDNFINKYSKVYEIKNLKVRQLFKFIFIKDYFAAKELLRQNLDLAYMPLSSNGEYLLHLLAHLDELEMIKFLVEELAVDLEQTTLHGFCVLFYMSQESLPQIINYWNQRGLSLNKAQFNQSIDILLCAIVFERLDVIEQIFTLGFVISPEAAYLTVLQKKLARSSYAIMERVVRELQKTPAIIAKMTFVHELSANAQLTTAQFSKMFEVFGDYLQKDALLFANPYCLGVVQNNLRYLQELHKYWQHNSLPAMINLPIDKQFAVPLVIALKSLFTMKDCSLDIIGWLLVSGAQPNIEYNSINSYPLLQALSKDNVALFGLLRAHGAHVRDSLVIQVLPALFLSKSFSVATLLVVINELDILSFNAINRGNEALVVGGMVDHDNLNLLCAFEEIMKNNYCRAPKLQFIDLFAVDLSLVKTNALHMTVMRNNYKFSEYLSNKFPALLLQINADQYTPFTLALEQASFDIIAMLLKVLQGFVARRVPMMLHDLPLEALLANNLHLTPLERADLSHMLLERQRSAPCPR